MKKAIHNLSLVMGFILLFGGALLLILGRVGTLDLSGIEKLPGVIIILASGLIIGGACETFIKKSKQMQIDAKDERNIFIGRTAKSFGFDIMTILLAIVMVVLVLFDFVSLTGFFALLAVYGVSQAAFVVRLWQLQKSA